MGTPIGGPIHVSFSTDSRFIQHTAVALYSVAANTRSPVVATILYDDLAEEHKRRLVNSLGPKDVEIRFKRVDTSELSELPILSPRMSRAAYFRIVLPYLVDADVDRVIYLDSDIVCRADLNQLWTTDIGDHTVGAVREATFRSGFVSRFGRSESGIVPLVRSFNSGVLLIDVAKWKERRITERAVAWRKANDKSKLHDQDALNAVLEGDWDELSARWNFAGFLRTTGYILSEHRDRLNPAIIHFGGASAPWEHTVNPYANHYHEYLAKTEWKNFQPGKVTTAETVRRRIVELKWTLRQLHYKIWPFSYGAPTELGYFGENVVGRYRAAGSRQTIPYSK